MMTDTHTAEEQGLTVPDRTEIEAALTAEVGERASSEALAEGLLNLLYPLPVADAGAAPTEETQG